MMKFSKNREVDSRYLNVPFKCKVIKKNGHVGIVYKDKFYPIDDTYGWVF